MLAELGAGTYGAVLAFPASFVVRTDEANVAQLEDPELGLSWYAFYEPGFAIDTSPAGHATLQRDVAAHAEYLFDLMLDPAAGPRPTRHPLIACEPTVVGNAPAVSILHRMVMRPGVEIVMGHLLVGLAGGVLELRWLARNIGPTGSRESALLIVEMGRRPGEDPALIGSAIDYDSPAHDALFPDHPLSRARVAEQWSRAALRVTQPAPVMPEDPVILQIGCAIAPPPRFAQHANNLMIGRFARLSLAVNDGLQFLVIERTLESADEKARQILNAHRLDVLAVQPVPVPPPLEQLAIVDGGGPGQFMRVATAIWSTPIRSYTATMVCTPQQPLAAIQSELVYVARSCRDR